GNRAVNKLCNVDEERGIVYFEAFAKSPLELHLYATSLTTEQPDEIKQITRAEGWHKVKVDDKGQFYVDWFCSPDTPPQVSLNNIDGTRITYLEANKLDKNHPYFPYKDNHSFPEFGTLSAKDGSDLYYYLLKPVPFDSTKKYPVIVDVYGGPMHQSVVKVWTEMWHQYMARQGYVIFCLDNRGTGSRGTAFDNPLYLQMGQIEVEDQVTGAEYLKTLPFVDSRRIGIF
ncbi:MAG: prolyl oligopeptidase family serine peptidase, partial [Planctomycetes bacterium]|nr:prolyl oligopeptidase family serine peptidase [Planctomycetota bacterium]